MSALADDHEPGMPRTLGAYPRAIGYALLVVSLAAGLAVLLGWDLGY